MPACLADRADKVEDLCLRSASRACSLHTAVENKNLQKQFPKRAPFFLFPFTETYTATGWTFIACKKLKWRCLLLLAMHSTIDMSGGPRYGGP
eukprot:scaffold127525_cov40-Prasinocladus_malaysianus.AAC.2